MLLYIGTNSLLAYDTATVYANNNEISRNLDLDAVASIFGESENLEDFERRLNDPNLQISNLDLNGDGQVDYLRVVETTEGTMHLIAIQAVIGYDRYQDIATIEVEKEYPNSATVQLVGNPYLYGPDYIIEPVYVQTPVIYSYFWAGMAGAAFYHAYYSPYRWGYYPGYYRPWHPRPIPYYRNHLRRHVNSRNYYMRTNTRRSHNARKIHNRVKRNDFARKHPNSSYDRRRSNHTTHINTSSNHYRNMHSNHPVSKRPSGKPTTAGRHHTGRSGTAQPASRPHSRQNLHRPATMQQQHQRSQRHNNRQRIQTGSLSHQRNIHQQQRRTQTHSVNRNRTARPSNTGRAARGRQ